LPLIFRSLQAFQAPFADPIEMDWKTVMFI
jgi:hypothetical protein